MYVFRFSYSLVSLSWTSASLCRFSENTPAAAISLPICRFSSAACFLFVFHHVSLICPRLKAPLHSRNLPAYSLLIGLKQGHSTDLVQEASFEAAWDTHLLTPSFLPLLPSSCCDEVAGVWLSLSLLAPFLLIKLANTEAGLVELRNWVLGGFSSYMLEG